MEAEALEAIFMESYSMNGAHHRPGAGARGRRGACGVCVRMFMPGRLPFLKSTVLLDSRRARPRRSHEKGTADRSGRSFSTFRAGLRLRLEVASP